MKSSNNSKAKADAQSVGHRKKRLFSMSSGGLINDLSFCSSPERSRYGGVESVDAEWPQLFSPLAIK